MKKKHWYYRKLDLMEANELSKSLAENINKAVKKEIKNAKKKK